MSNTHQIPTDDQWRPITAPIGRPKSRTISVPGSASGRLEDFLLETLLPLPFPALGVALLFPNPEKGGRGKTVPKQDGFSKQRLSDARAVLAYSRELAVKVRGTVPAG